MSHEKRATIKQDVAPRQLRFISRDSGYKNDLEKDESYYYDDSAGQGIRVYVMDSGLNVETSVSSQLSAYRIFSKTFAVMGRTNTRVHLPQTLRH